MSNIFKGQQKPTPHMGPAENKDSEGFTPFFWRKRPQWQPGNTPEGGFNPIYRANQTQPPLHAESTPNFSLRKKEEEK